MRWLVCWLGGWGRREGEGGGGWMGSRKVGRLVVIVMFNIENRKEMYFHFALCRFLLCPLSTCFAVYQV